LFDRRRERRGMLFLGYFFLILLFFLLLLLEATGQLLDLIIAASLVQMEGSSLLIVLGLICLAALEAIHQFIHILHRPILNIDAARSGLAKLTKVLILLRRDVFAEVGLLSSDVFSGTVTHGYMPIIEIV
jgi:hypothetical protein